MLKVVRALIALAVLTPPGAHAAEVACRYEGGVITAPAEVAGVAGDYILDTGDPLTRLHLDRALAEGFDQPTLSADIRFAGQALTGRTVTVTNLDARTYALPTPVAGVIGADVLKGFVLDVSFAPCRIRLSKPGRAPAFRAATTLPLTWRAGLPAAPAAVAGENGAARLSMAPSTGSDMTVRLSDAVASVQHPAKPDELYPGGVGYSRLRAASFAGRLFERPKTALFKAQAGGPDGSLGPDILAAWRLRFDFPHGRLLLAPARRSP